MRGESRLRRRDATRIGVEGGRINGSEGLPETSQTRMFPSFQTRVFPIFSDVFRRLRRVGLFTSSRVLKRNGEGRVRP